MKWKTKTVVAEGKITYSITNLNIENGNVYSYPWNVQPFGKNFKSLKEAKKFCNSIDASTAQYFKEKVDLYHKGKNAKIS